MIFGSHEGMRLRGGCRQFKEKYRPLTCRAKIGHYYLLHIRLIEVDRYRFVARPSLLNSE